MKFAVPTLDTKGWVTSIDVALDYLITGIFVSDARQSYLYNNTITNFQEPIQRFAENNDGLTSYLENTITDYLKRYFPEGAMVSVTLSTDPNDEGLTIVHISGYVIDASKKYDIAKSIETNNKIFTRFVNINNEGNSQ